MKQIILCFTIFFGSVASNAQTIRKFDCIKVREDSVSTTYSLQVSFRPPGDKDKRLNLVKKELERNYQITPNKIISIQSFAPKTYGRCPYRVVVRKDGKKNTNFAP